MGSVCPGGYASLSQGWLWELCMAFICSPVGLPNVSQAGLELTFGGVGALLISQCNVTWRSFVWARGSGCQSFDSSWCFFSDKCGFSISAIFLIYRAHDLCFCTLLTIMYPLICIYWYLILYNHISFKK
jgi:hypothetical protein